MHKFIFVSAILLLATLITGCGSNHSSKTNDGGLTIYTSIYPIEYLVDKIGGDKTNVVSVYPPGVDGHTYEPTTMIIRDIARADAFIYMGAGMEGFIEAAEEALHNQDVDFIEIAAHKELFPKSDADGQDGHDHDHAGINPHIWFDPLRMIEMADIIKDELTALKPKDKDLFQTNYEAVKQELTTLDDTYTTTLQNKKQKHILVAHEAYGYWKERYGIEQIAVNGMFDREPSQKDLTKITKTAKEHHIKYVIFEQNGTERVAEIIQKHINADPLTIHNLEVRTEDDVDKKRDYIQIMQDNLNVLDKATD